MSFAKISLFGNLGKAPELKTFNGGYKAAKFSLAVEDGRKVGSEWQNHTTWYFVSAWDKLAEKAMELSKGARVFIDGRISSSEGKDGKIFWDVTATSIVCVDKKEKAEAEASSLPAEPETPPSYDDIPF